MKKPEDILDTANLVLDKRGWVSGYLVKPEPNEDGSHSHCALGAIGYAAFGEKFDGAVLAAGSDSAGMSLLASTPETRAAVIRLANEVRAAEGRAMVEITAEVIEDDWKLNEAAGEIINYNDSTGGKTGRRVKNRFKKFAKKFKKNTPVVEPVQHELAVEIVPASDTTARVGQLHKEVV